MNSVLRVFNVLTAVLLAYFNFVHSPLRCLSRLCSHRQRPYIFAESIAGSSSAAAILTSTTAAPDLSADTTTSSSLFDVDEELAKIAASCLSNRNFEQLSGNIIRAPIARLFGDTLIAESVVSIGLTELRAKLKFAPLRPWQNYIETDPSEEELAAAPTIEAYYDMKEPRSDERSLDAYFLFEHNLTPAIAYLDKRFPSIRTMFRRTFEEIRRSEPAVLDRKAIDRMIVEFDTINKRVGKAIKQMHNNRRKCWKRGD